MLCVRHADLRLSDCARDTVQHILDFEAKLFPALGHETDHLMDAAHAVDEARAGGANELASRVSIFYEIHLFMESAEMSISEPCEL
jgi:hypothetical protein